MCNVSCAFCGHLGCQHAFAQKPEELAPSVATLLLVGLACEACDCRRVFRELPSEELIEARAGVSQ